MRGGCHYRMLAIGEKSHFLSFLYGAAVQQCLELSVFDVDWYDRFRLKLA